MPKEIKPHVRYQTSLSIFLRYGNEITFLLESLLKMEKPLHQ